MVAIHTCGEHDTMYKLVESLCHTPGTNVTFHVHSTQIKINIKSMKKTRIYKYRELMKLKTKYIQHIVY